MFLTLQTTIASTTIPRLDHFSTLEFDLMGFCFSDKYKTISDFGPGKITLNGGGSGKVKVCNEYSDIFATDTQTIALKVTFGLIMSDYTALYLEYYGRVVPDKNCGGILNLLKIS